MKLKYLLIILVVLLIGAGGAFWYYFMMGAPQDPNIEVIETPSPSGFIPLPRPSGTNTIPENSFEPATSTEPTETDEPVAERLPELRQITTTAIGGYGASSTRAATLVRWVDRGRGNVYETASDSFDIVTLSNTIVPKIMESSWNRNATAFIGSLLSETDLSSSVVYGELQKDIATGSTPFMLKGKNFPGNVITYAVSPRKDKIFIVLKENDVAVGYTASFNGGALTRIMSTPLTQIVTEWPEDNTITITTKASASQNGYLYFVNPKSGSMKKVLGPLQGLVTTTSHDAKYVFASYVNPQESLQASFYNVAKASLTDAGFVTIAEKCAWGNSYKDVVYCGVPTRLEAVVYPDDWHIGTATFIDRIWQASATSAEIKLLSTPTQQARTIIDAFKLDLDPKDDFLFFMNKNDLTLWSLDLVTSQ